MKTITSADGTTIAFDQAGQGPGLILVGGMFEQQALDSETAQLAAFPLLRQHFTVYHYDRRGRGGSTDTQPFAVRREIEDIEALIDEAGGSAFLFGISSGGALAFEAALALAGKVKKLAVYDPPYNDDPDGQQRWRTFRKQLAELLASDRRGDAVGLFMMLVGMPAEQLDGMRQHPQWPLWEAAAPTIAYDAAAVGEDASVPAGRAANLAVPTLVINGGETFPFMVASGAALAEAIPSGHHLVLEGQIHEVAAAAIAPVLVEFFTGAARTP